MVSIPEHTEVDDFVDWDNAGPAVGTDGIVDISPKQVTFDLTTDLDLALENTDADDFSFWALEHFSASNVAGDDAAPPTFAPQDLVSDALPQTDWFETPEEPCTACQLHGYQCKRLKEGQYRGYCTCCVALRQECSFGPERAGPSDDTFPPNPWPTLGDHPNVIPNEDGNSPNEAIQPENLCSTSGSDLAGLTATATEQRQGPTTGPKVGARFSRESVRILKNWLSSHHRHPYPTEEEKEGLQRQTGLNKTQIANWLANARRRGKIQPPRSTSPHVRGYSSPIDIPQRRGTPALEAMNPLQRWVDSPPENEPASVTAIARAVTASSSTLSSGLNSPYSYNYTDDGSGRSIGKGSSASSVNTSQSSGGSFASAYSHGSRGSFGSYSSFNQRGRRRRRRRAAPKYTEEKTSLATPLKTFQCTFCTETFRTKHDWQRHEKSLHLSMERWVCAPRGPRSLNPETGLISCVFCGEANPDDAHVESHNYSACQERSLTERTFYRKDHLRQHLKLVHDVKMLGWSMEPWKVATPEIRSRCGFCGIVMDTWTIRVDHLAEHFKTGNTMADWKGDWGFEAPVLQLVENAIAPFLIHNERHSPLPFVASRGSPESPTNAYELLKHELVYTMLEKVEQSGREPTDEEIQYEACRIIFGSEVLSETSLSPSWLRDLLMSSVTITRKAQLAPIRGYKDSKLASLKIIGKDQMFQDCPLEQQLRDVVKARNQLGLTSIDHELQDEASNIISRMEGSSSSPSEPVARFLLRLLRKSSQWLAPFRRRAHLPRSEDIGVEHLRSKDPTKIDSTIHNYSRLETELAEHVKVQRLLGIEPNDADLQRQARNIIYDCDDAWNQTAADNADWLNVFKQRHMSSAAASQGQSSPGHSPLELSKTSPITLSSLRQQKPHPSSIPTPSSTASASTFPVQSETASQLQRKAESGCTLKASPFFLNDANCYRRLARELRRFVTVTMSPNNPNCHVPTDEELQYQSRLILYDDDDPWNQTAADNAEWLRRFKRDVGILADAGGPGLPAGDAWNVQQGGSGFAPPYAFPRAGHMAPCDDQVSVSFRDGAKAFVAAQKTVNGYLRDISTRLDRPAEVFCSRELENGLAAFVGGRVSGGGSFPDDVALQARAREILNVQHTAAEDAILLDKFKTMMMDRMAAASMAGAPVAIPAPAPALPSATIDLVLPAQPQPQAPAEMMNLDTSVSAQGLDLGFDLAMNDDEMNELWQGMNFEFDASDLGLGGDLSGSQGFSSMG